jgi:hypothetical protein
MSIPRININRFNPDILESRRLNGSPPTIVIIGKRGTGKSTLIKDLLWHMRKTPLFVCMSGTEEGNGFYGKFIHPLCVHDGYKPEIISNIISQQRHKMKKCIKEKVEPNTKPNLGVGILLDDCGYDKKIMKQKDIYFLFMNGRHYKICFIVSLQYMMGMPPDLRTNIDFVFCLRENISSNQKRLYDNFFGCFSKFSHFQETFNACTNNHECIVLDNTSKSTKIEDCVFYYKANPDLNFRIGSPELWNYLDNRYNENFDDEDDNEEGQKKFNTISIRKSPDFRQ